jgi:hypothetical protein
MAGVPEREAIDVRKLGVLFDGNDVPEEADVLVPVAPGENRERDARIAAYVTEAEPAPSMFSRTRPSSQSYQVGTVCGEPSGRTVPTTAGLG